MSTPRGGGWFHAMYRRGQGGRDASYESWSSPSSANPYLDKMAIEAERARLPDEVFRQEYLAEFIQAEEEPCDACGFPVPDANGYTVLLVGQELPLCLECERPVDEHGKCLVMMRPDGSTSPEIKCLILSSMPATEPSDRAPDLRTMYEVLDVCSAPRMAGAANAGWMEWP